MLDLLRLYIPFKPEFVQGGEGYSYISAQVAIDDGVKGEVNLTKFAVPLSARRIERDEDGFWKPSELTHPFEGLPSSFTDIAFKIISDGSYYPGVVLKASPAKVLQGHNVFGSTSIKTAAYEFLGLLSQVYPELYNALDIPCTQVTTMDVTFSARFASQRILEDVIDFMRGVSIGQTKARKGCNYATTAYWGSEASRLKTVKAYLKEVEFFHQLTEMTKLAKRGDANAKRVVDAMTNPDVQKWVKGLLRLEASVKKRWLERRNLPTNLFQLVAYQERLAADGRCFLQELWQDCTTELFKAFEGMTMKVIDDDHVLDALKDKFYTMTPKGNISYGKALRLFTFYRHLCEFGYSETKRVTPRNTLWRHMEDLVEAGLSRGYLQGLEPNKTVSNVIPFIRLVPVDFGAQRPDNWIEPVSRFSQVA